MSICFIFTAYVIRLYELKKTKQIINKFKKKP